MEQQYCIHITQGKKAGQIVPLESEMIIGRDPSCDIVLDDQGISRKHAMLILSDKTVVLEDLQSTNGTFVNSRSVERKTITEGDNVQIGDSAMELIRQRPSMRSKSSPAEFYIDEETTLSFEDSKIINFEGYQVNIKASESLQKMYELLRDISLNLNRDELIRKLYEFCEANFKSDHVIIYLTEENGLLTPYTNKHEEETSREIQEIGRAISRHVLQNKEGILASHGISDSLVIKIGNKNITKVSGLMCVPLTGKRRQCGAVYIDCITGRHTFTEQDLEFLTATAIQMGIALENTSLYREQVKLAEFTDSIIESLGAGLLVTDTNQVIKRINTAGRKLLDIEDPVGKRLSEYDCMIGFEKEINRLQSQKDYRVRGEVEISLREKDLTLGLSVSSQLDFDGRLIGTICIFRDLTEIKKMTEQLRRARHLASLGEMAAGIAHEIRNPLNSIRGFSELLSESEDTSSVKEYSQIIIDESDRLNYIVQEILDFSRQKKFRMNRINLNQLVSNLTKSLKIEAGEKELHLETNCTEDLPQIEGNEEKLKQVIINIAQNGIQAMDQGTGTLTIQTGVSVAEERLPEVIVEITDTGYGIQEKDLKKIFDPFFTKRDVGTGLGLSICQRVMDGHNGRIEVDSKIGSGTTFRLIFPAASPQKADSSE